MPKWPIGVFASIDAGLGVKLEVVQRLGIPTIQLHAPARPTRTREAAEKFLAQLAAMNVRITTVFCGFDGESYADIATCARTVGLVPPATRAERLQEMQEIADFAKLLGVGEVGLHIGFIPHDTASEDYTDIVRVAREACDHCTKNGQAVHLETGQESADGLLAFLRAVDRDNLFVNFDPANMILYGSGDPIEALKKVGPYVRGVHCKDATWSDNPGETWGCEVPFGQGQVGAETFLRTLREVGYTGPLTIEREIPDEPARQMAEIGQGVNLINQLKMQISG